MNIIYLIFTAAGTLAAHADGLIYRPSTPTVIFAHAAPVTRLPTKAMVDALKAAPTDTNCETFDRLFGNGAAARYINRVRR